MTKREAWEHVTGYVIGELSNTEDIAGDDNLSDSDIEKIEWACDQLSRRIARMGMPRK